MPKENLTEYSNSKLWLRNTSSASFDINKTHLDFLCRGCSWFYTILKEDELRPIINVQPDEEDIYRQLEQLILHPERIAKLKRDSVEYIRRHHDSIKVAKQYIDVWSR